MKPKGFEKNGLTTLNGLNNYFSGKWIYTYTMSTYRQIYYQIVYSTKNRESCISIEYEHELYKYIWGHYQPSKKQAVQN